MKYLVLLSSLFSSLSFAGGITCKQCPGESAYCAPRVDCATDADKIFQCRINGAVNGFKIIEETPQLGFATIIEHNSIQVLRFTQKRESRSTRCGAIHTTTKTYFDSKNEYRLYLRQGDLDCYSFPENLTGTYSWEPKSQVKFKCTVPK